MRILNNIHNLMLNCNTKQELRALVLDVGLNNMFSGHYDELIDNVLDNPVLAAECSVLPIYYLKASNKTGMKQYFNGQWYNPNEVL